MLGQRRRSLAFEYLEDRRLLAFAAEGSLVGIKGTKGDDVIRVSKPSSGYIQLTMNGEHATYSSGGFSAVLVLGLAGNDQITIDDNVNLDALIDAGKGDDTVTTTSGDDIVLGGAGNDTIFAKGGSDKVDGGAGNDTIDAGDGDDEILGGKGNDTIHGGDGTDSILGDAGIDALYGNDGNDAVGGGKGNDQLFGGDGDDIVLADAGIDLCYGGDGDDRLDAGAGNDTVFGDDGNDIILAGAGVDECHGGDGKDALFGEAGNDSLYGDDNTDHLDGGKGADALRGGGGDDQIKGGLGNDLLDGESGDNLLDNEAERDTMLNGIVADLDLEFRAGPPDANGLSFAQLDLQNVNGQVVTKFTVHSQSIYNIYHVTVAVDDIPIDPVPVSGAGGDAVVTFSSDPTGNELPFPLGMAPPHVGSRIAVGHDMGFSSSSAVQTYVI